MGIAILFLILSYFIGSIPFGLIIGKLSGKDLRKHGSGNIGSTNAVRTLGVKLGALSALCDVTKGALIIIIIRLLEHYGVWNNPIVINGESVYTIYGLMAVIGHCYPIYLKFKGGKAVATSLGALIVTLPWTAIVALVIFAIALKISGYVSLSSTLATLGVLLTCFTLYTFIYNNIFNSLFVIGFAALIFIRHIPNYKRLLNGTEHNFKKKKAL